MMNVNVTNKRTCVEKFLKVQNSISWILTKIQVHIQNIAKKMISWIINSISLNFFYTGYFIWFITLHSLKYLDKPIKWIKISSENYWDFSLYFHLYLKIGHLFHIPQFWEKMFFLFTLKAKYHNVQPLSVSSKHPVCSNFKIVYL